MPVFNNNYGMLLHLSVKNYWWWGADLNSPRDGNSLDFCPHYEKQAPLRYPCSSILIPGSFKQAKLIDSSGMMDSSSCHPFIYYSDETHFLFVQHWQYEYLNVGRRSIFHRSVYSACMRRERDRIWKADYRMFEVDSKSFHMTDFAKGSYCRCIRRYFLYGRSDFRCTYTISSW